MKEPELEFGGVYTGKIVEIRSNGVLIQLYKTMLPALLPNSQLDRRKVMYTFCPEIIFEIRNIFSVEDCLSL